MVHSPFYRIWLGITEQRDITEWVESFRYEDCLKEDSLLDLSIKEDYALSFLDDPLVITGVIVSFQFGILGRCISPVHKAKITNVDATYSERVTVRMQALDLGVKMKKYTSHRVWKGKKASDIAKELATKYGLDAEIQPTARVIKSVAQGHRNDLEFLQYLAKREGDGNYICYIRNDKLFFGYRGLDKAASFAHKFGEDEGWISFTPRLRELTAHQSSIKAKTASYDMLAKKATGSSAGDKSNKNNINLGEYVVVYDENGIKKGERKITNGQPLPATQSPTDGILETVTEAGKTFITPTKDPIEAKALMNHEYKEQKLAQLEADFVTELEPLVFPNTVLTIENVAKRHVGNWFIEKVTHVIDSGNASSTRVMRKNAVKANTGNKGANVNKTVGKKKAGGEDVRIISVYDENGNHIKDKTSSGKYVAPKD